MTVIGWGGTRGAGGSLTGSTESSWDTCVSVQARGKAERLCACARACAFHLKFKKMSLFLLRISSHYTLNL